MTTVRDAAVESEPPPPRTSIAPVATVLIVLAVIVASVPGFLDSPLGPYDESALVLGARLMSNGLSPYTDFYTNYGPLGYELMRPFLVVGSPGVAYRVAQIVTLGGLTVLLFALMRRSPRPAGFGVLAVLAALNLTAAAFCPLFFGFAFAVLGLAAWAEAFGLGGSRARILVLLTSATLALTFLARPAFAVYVGGTLLVVSLVLHRGPLGAIVGRLAACFAGAAVFAALAWALLFSTVSPVDAFYSALVLPSIIFRSSARALLPYFLRPGVPTGIQLGFAALLSISTFLLASSWLGAAPARATRRPLLVGVAMAGLAPFLLLLLHRPGSTMWIVSALLFGASAAALVAGREAVARSPFLTRAAFFGIAAVAFLHYLWSRADVPHLIPALSLASLAALCAAPEYGRRGYRILVSLFLPGAFALALVSYPIVILPRAARRFGGAGTASWLAAAVPPDARLAVNFADRYADPASRFVAVASDHRRTDANPILLFLLSSRRPYTRWYSYDPGVQSSPAIQATMIRELESSSSATAVVWPTDRSADGRQDLAEPTPLDRRIAGLYPIPLARFGIYEVRGRGGARASPDRP